MATDYTSQLAAALQRPPNDPLVAQLAALIADLEVGRISIESAEALLSGDAGLQAASSLISFQRADVGGSVTIGDVAGGNIVKIAINVPTPPPPIDLATAQARFAAMPTDTLPDV